MSIFLKNVFNGLFDVTDDISILPSWERCIWLNLVNGAGTRHYKVRLTLDTRPFIIQGWIELLPKKKILCPICNTPMKFVRASLKMNGGGRANASDDAPVSSP